MLVYEAVTVGVNRIEGLAIGSGRIGLGWVGNSLRIGLRLKIGLWRRIGIGVGIGIELGIGIGIELGIGIGRRTMPP